MNGKSLVEYLGEIRPTTPQELTAATFEWMRYRLVMDFNESYRRLVKECVDQFEKWLDM